MSQRHVSTKQFQNHLEPERSIQGIAATLLPFEQDGSIAVDAFKKHVARTHDAGLLNAVNMDTGYANFLTDDQKQDVLQWTREALGDDADFVAGVYIEEDDGEAIDCYRRRIEEVLEYGATPILFQTSRLHGLAPEEKVKIYEESCKGYPDVIAFELGKMFADFGEIYQEKTIRGLMDVPEIAGLKHSSLDRLEEFKRLQIRDDVDPDFRIYTGNDLGINMIEYGSDYLLGLATFAPEKFAERDRLWEEGDADYYALSDALQFLGNVAFREPIPAYRHTAAVFLHMLGHIPSPKPHPDCPNRPNWEAEMLENCAERLGFSV
jgi:4-hydroxy-tetrahydrodipicolinate synthase